MIPHVSNEPIQEALPLRKTLFFKETLLSAGFIILLFLPTLDHLANLSAGFKSTEKRMLAPLPTFRFPHVQTYIAEYNKYYKENFGWRNVLFHQYSHFKFSVLGISPLPDKVVIGKNGWFFPGNSVDRILDQHRGLTTISTDTLASITRRLSQFQHQFEAMGIKFYVLIAPDSYSIYPENLPDHLSIIPHVSNFDYLKTYVSQHSTVRIIDVRPAFIAAKAGHRLYFKTDTHWNDYGALVASQTLVNSIRQDFPKLPVASSSDFTARTAKGNEGDLVMMLSLNDDVIDSNSYQIKPTRFITHNTQTVNDIHHTIPSHRFVSTSKQLPKLLLIGDSFSVALNYSLPNYFRESYLVRDHTCDMALVKREQPDIVVFEIVERNLGKLGQF